MDHLTHAPQDLPSSPSSAADAGSSDTRGTVAVLGCFDGVHRGHAALLAAAKAAANARELPLLVWSMTGKPGEGAGLLCTEEARRTLLFAAGGERVILAPFSAVHTLSCEEFVRDTLVKTLHAVQVFCGENFRFGAGGRGDADLLRTLFAAYGGETTVLPLLRQDVLPGETAEDGTPFAPFAPAPPISSTRIRKLLCRGDPAGAAVLLGRYFAIEGEVLHGRALGRKLGFPTANLRFPGTLVSPKRGVYFGHAVLPSGKRHAAVCNLGVRPTVESEGELLLECCLLDFSDSIYGVTLRVELEEFLRPERPFSTKEALRAQVLCDLAEGRRRAAAETAG